MPEAPAPVVFQEWHGYVTEVSEASFECRLLDVTAGDTVESEMADIRLEQVPEAERGLVRPGAYFKWFIERVPGAEDAVSCIDFASTPCWTEEEIERAKAKARELYDAITWI